MSNQLMNPDFANHFVALLSCILTNRTKFTSINQTMYQLLVCKLFIFSFSCLQTIYLGFFDFANNFFQDFSSPPPPKNNGPSLNTSFSARKELLMNMVQKTQVKPLLENGPS